MVDLDLGGKDLGETRRGVDAVVRVVACVVGEGCCVWRVVFSVAVQIRGEVGEGIL